MKSLIWALCLLSFSFTGLFAQQVPNSSFESWSQPYNPDGWFTYTAYLNFLGQASQDTDSKFEGQASAKIQTINFAGANTFETLVYGNFTYSPLQIPAWQFYPLYFPFRPDTLSFVYTYSTPGLDSASASIRLSAGANVLIEKLIKLPPNTDWTPVSIHLAPLYASGGEPDSLLLQFKSSNVRSNFFGVAGSILNLDAVHFGYKNTTSVLDEKHDSDQVQVFPNPANTHIHFRVRNPIAFYSIVIVDGTGRVMAQFSTGQDVFSIHTEAWSPGVYFYHIYTGSSFVSSGKIMVTH